MNAGTVVIAPAAIDTLGQTMDFVRDNGPKDSGA
jgi:hypothetical protein